MRTQSQRPVVMVEDADFDFEMAERGFRRMGISAPILRHRELSSAAKFLQGECRTALGEKRPGVVILDLQLLDGDGRELLAVIKKDESLKSIPVVVWSSSDDPATVDACYRDGANSYIQKVADNDRTARAIERFAGYWLETVTLPSSSV